jgi:Kelch motif/Galactose oxidase, central domain
MSTRLTTAAFAVLLLATPALADPPTGTWHRTADLHSVTDFTATLLESGEVLVVGGRTHPSSRTRLCRIYDPLTDDWRPAASLPAPRAHHAAIRLATGEVLVTGGHNGSNDPRYETLIYDPATDSWEEAGREAWRVNQIPCAPRLLLLDDGRVFAVNEHDGRDARLFDPGTRTWRSAGDDLLSWRRGAPLGGGFNLAKLPDGRVFMTVTADTGTWPTPGACLLFDPQAGTMIRGPGLYHNAKVVALPDGRVIGAQQEDTSVWSPPSYSQRGPRLRYGTSRMATLPSGRVVAFRYTDHRTEGQQLRVSLLDPAAPTLSWETLGSGSAAARWDHQYVVLTSGQIMLLGGEDATYKPMPTWILTISDEAPPSSNTDGASTRGIVGNLNGGSAPEPPPAVDPTLREARIEDGRLHVYGAGLAGDDVRVYLGRRRMALLHRDGATHLVADLPATTVGSSVRVRVDGRPSPSIRLDVPSHAPRMLNAQRTDSLLVIHGVNLGQAGEDVRVFLGDASLPVLSSGPTHIAVLAGRRTGTLQVEVNGVRSERRTLR